MASTPITAELLEELAHYQIWADSEHWKALHQNGAVLDDPEIRKRLNHMVTALRMLTLLARGGTPDFSAMKDIESAEQLEAAQRDANADVMEALKIVDLQKMIALPRGPRGPWEAPAGVLLLQAMTHSLHHRAQNASRLRQLGVNPPMTDFVLWYANGRP
jgi:uncharacterized damage-inducible protein DinB